MVVVLVGLGPMPFSEGVLILNKDQLIPTNGILRNNTVEYYSSIYFIHKSCIFYDQSAC